MPTVLTNGVALRYEVHGEGPPVLLLPPEGMGGWVWFRQVPAIKRLAQLVTFDPRGSGETHSHQAQPEYSLAAMANDVVGLLQALRLDQAALAGVDLGAMVALEVAARRPELVSRLVLVSSAVSGDPAAFLGDEALRLRQDIADIDPATRFRSELGLMLAPGFSQRNPGVLDSLAEQQRQAGAPDVATGAIRQSMAAWRAPAVWPRCPTLIFGGAEDRYQREGSLERLAEAAGGLAQRLGACGHLPHIEQPDTFNRLLMNFLFEEVHPASTALRGVE